MPIKIVQLQMIDETLEKIEKLKVILNTQNRSQIVKTSVDLASMIFKAMDRGEDVILIGRCGRKIRVTLPGIFD